jgi:hypothetical protein
MSDGGLIGTAPGSRFFKLGEAELQGWWYMGQLSLRAFPNGQPLNRGTGVRQADGRWKRKWWVERGARQDIDNYGSSSTRACTPGQHQWVGVTVNK